MIYHVVSIAGWQKAVSLGFYEVVLLQPSQPATNGCRIG
jgi:hypothetical protein